LPCRHALHYACALPWLHRGTCPTCRAELPVKPEQGWVVRYRQEQDPRVVSLCERMQAAKDDAAALAKVVAEARRGEMFEPERTRRV
jgi:hypothetical protein